MICLEHFYLVRANGADMYWAGGVRGVADGDHAAPVPRRELRPVVQAKLHERARPPSAYVSGPLMVSHSLIL